MKAGYGSMEFFEAVRKRYTHKEKFKSDAVPREHLEAIASAGLAAPSGGNTQSVGVIIIDDRDILGRLCGIAASNGLRTAPVAIAVLINPAMQMENTDYTREDYSAVTENMLLAATALGYASVWLDYILVDRDVQLSYLKVLCAPETFLLPVILPIGIPDGEGSRREKIPIRERISYNRYGSK
jgi:nitroreductase